MGQTLTHGIYLPDEGERNCYNGLASNWQLLDGAVGTIAEHSTQIAGKAPLVHTHTKSDVTDLFNSANTWSALNSYSNGQIRIKSQSQEIGVIPSSGVIQYLEFADKNDAQHGIVGLWDYANGASEIQMYITDKFKNGAKDPTGTSETTILSFGFKTDGSKFLTFSGQVDNSVIPYSNNTYDLGSSSYQWNNLYAKNYYYNGVAWGLDKYNQWTGVNDFNDLIGLNNAELWFKQPNIEDITTNPSADTSKSILQIWNRATTQYCGGIINGLMADGTHKLTISCLGFPLNNYGGYYPHSFSFEAKRDGTASFSPNYTNASLGTSTNKWKTLNGINPGALSLLSGGTTENTDWFNVAGDILPTGGNATDFNWGQNYFTPSKDGWLALTIQQCSSISVWCDTLKYGMSVAAPNASLNRQLLIPVVANIVYEIRISGNSWFSARLIMPKGNV